MSANGPPPHPPRPRVLLAWSSGKDSAWALHRLRAENKVELCGLLSTVTRDYDRVSIHGVRAELLEAQAAAVGLPLMKVFIPAKCSHDIYAEAMRAACEKAKADGVTHVAFGDLFLEDIRAYRKERLAQAGLVPLFPLWGLDTHALAREMISAGVKAYVSCLDPKNIPRELAGHAYDAAFLDALPEGVDPCAEHGEFHTFAWDGPQFNRPVACRVGETVERSGFVFTDLLPA